MAGYDKSFIVRNPLNALSGGVFGKNISGVSVDTSGKILSGGVDLTQLFAPQSSAANWNSAYSITSSNSANWNASYTTLTSTSSNWNNTTTTVSSNSANWNSSYTTLTANSASWGSGSGNAAVNTAVTANSANWNSSYTTLTANSASWGSGSGNAAVNAAVTANSANWNSSYTILTANSANWNNTTTTVSSNSANWNTSYATLTANSASWGSGSGNAAVNTAVTANSANWNSSYTTLTANSANWNFTYTIVSTNSANWSPAGTGTELQFRNAGAFGAITNSFVTGGNTIILGAAEALGATVAPRLILRNTTAAINGTAQTSNGQQMSPSFELEGQGFDLSSGVSATTPVRTRMYVAPQVAFSSNTIPNALVRLETQVGSGAWTRIFEARQSTSQGFQMTFGPSSNMVIGGAASTATFNDGISTRNVSIDGTSTSTTETLRMLSAGGLTWSSDNTFTNYSLWLRRRASANLCIGSRDSASPVAQTISVQSVSAGSANSQGAIFTIDGSQSTGNADGGDIRFRTTKADSTPAASATQNALNDVFRIKSTGAVNFAPLSTDPVTYLSAGDLYYNSSLSAFKYYTGAVWTQFGGSGDASVNAIVIANSAYWNSAYTTLTANSASWGSGSGNAAVDALVIANSANWDTSYTTLTANSANWSPAGTGTELQFRNGTTFGFVTGTSVTATTATTEIILGDTETLTLLSATNATQTRLRVRNTNPATSTYKQNSPAITWEGRSWATGGTPRTVPVQFRAFIETLIGGNGGGNFTLQASVENEAFVSVFSTTRFPGGTNYGTTLYGNVFISQNGSLTLNGSVKTNSTGSFLFASTTDSSQASDVFLRRGGANNLTLGPSNAATVATMSAQTISVQSAAGAANLQGALFTIDGSRSTGNALGGDIRFRTTKANSTPALSTTQNTLDEVFRIKSTGAINLTPPTTEPSPGASGDMYYNSSTNRLNVHDGVVWRPINESRTIATFTALQNQPVSANFATINTRSVDSLAVLTFTPGSVSKEARFVGVIPDGAVMATPGLTVRAEFCTVTATTGVCRWAAQIKKLSSASYATSAAVDVTVSGTAGLNTMIATIPLTAYDSLTEGNAFALRIFRDSGNAADTMTGDSAQLLTVEVRTQ